MEMLDMMSYKRLRPDLLPPPPPPHLPEKLGGLSHDGLSHNGLSHDGLSHNGSQHNGQHPLPPARVTPSGVASTGASHSPPPLPTAPQTHLLCPLPPRLPSASRPLRGPSPPTSAPAQAPAHSSAHAAAPRNPTAYVPPHALAQFPAADTFMGESVPLFAQGLCTPLPPSTSRRSPAAGAAGLAGRRRLQRANTAGSSIPTSASHGCGHGGLQPGLSPSSSPVIGGNQAALSGNSAGNFGGFGAFDSPSNSPFSAAPAASAVSAASAASVLRRCSTAGPERERPQMLARDWSVGSSIHNITFPENYPPELLPQPPPPMMLARARGEDAAALRLHVPRDAAVPAASAPQPGSASPAASASAISAAARAHFFAAPAAPPARVASPPAAPFHRNSSSSSQIEPAKFAGLKRPSDLPATAVSPRGLVRLQQDARLARDNSGDVSAFRGSDNSAGESEEMPPLLEHADVALATLVNGLEEGGRKGVLVTDEAMMSMHDQNGDVTKTGLLGGPFTGGSWEEGAAVGACNEKMDDAGEMGEMGELNTFDLTQMEGLDLPIVMSEANLDEISGISSADLLTDLPQDLFADLPSDEPFDIVTLCDEGVGMEGLSDNDAAAAAASEQDITGSLNDGASNAAGDTNADVPNVHAALVTSTGATAVTRPASVVTSSASPPPPPPTPGNPPLLSCSSVSPTPLLKLPPLRLPQEPLRATPSPIGATPSPVGATPSPNGAFPLGKSPRCQVQRGENNRGGGVSGRAEWERR
ncbi:hypothetical protein CLOM_g15372 [Closterium sp. NIES-68]|nr:hypothetical protein CLOM_g15372 [Closterium sp. NIES-68]GJP86616.1 hypothetical protein CLOP_g16617 [Closterium sp. NIES-67]